MADDLAQARAVVEKQHEHVSQGVALLLDEAQRLLMSHDEIEAWAFLSTQITMRLDCATERSQFVAAMLGALVVRQVAGHE